MSLIIKLSASGYFERIRYSVALLKDVLKLFEKSQIEQIFVYDFEPALSFDKRQAVNKDDFLNELKKRFDKLDLVGKSRFGVEIEGKIEQSSKIINFFFFVYPEIRSRYESFDINFDIYPEDFDSFEVFIKAVDANFEKKLCSIFSRANLKVGEFEPFIKKAFITNGEFFDIRNRRFSYYSSPAELIVDAIKTSKVDDVEEHILFENKFALVNETKLANLINRSEKYNIGISAVYEKAQVVSVSGSLCLIPKEDNSMIYLFTDFKDKILKPIAQKLVGKDIIVKQIKDLELY